MPHNIPGLPDDMPEDIRIVQVLIRLDDNAFPMTFLVRAGTQCTIEMAEDDQMFGVVGFQFELDSEGHLTLVDSGEFEFEEAPQWNGISPQI